MKPKELSIGAARELFLYHQHSKGIAEKTLSNAEGAINVFLCYTGIRVDEYINVIDKELVETFIDKLRQSKLSLASQNLWLAHLRVFLYWCMEEELIKDFKIRLIKGQQQKIKFFTDDEVSKLLNHSRGCPFVEDRTHTIVCLILSTGARASTILNLKIEDLDFKSRTITFTHLKNKSIAIIPMSNSLYNVLQKYIATWELKEYLFSNIHGQQLSLSALETSLRRYCTDREVKPRGPHALRHSFSRLYIKNGGDAFSLQKILTHSSMEMTRRYVDLFSEDLRTSMNNYIPLDKLTPNVTKISRRTV